MQLSEPLKRPGTRLAHEHHGIKSGKIWRYERLEIGGKTVFVPRRCPNCWESYTYDERELPHCPVCGEEPKESREQETEEIRRYKRIKSAKRGRIILRC